MVNFDIKPPNNSLEDSRAGMLGAKVISHNIFNKSYDVNTYGYFSDFTKHERIDEKNHPKYNDNIEEWPDSRIYVHPTSKSGSNLNAQYRDENNSNNSVIANQINETILHRKERMYELDFSNNIALEIHGITGITAGDIIEIKYTAPGRNHDIGTLDKSKSGRYLITKLRHTFSPVTSQHQISMVVSRDSLPSELPFSKNVAEVKKQGKSQVLDITT